MYPTDHACGSSRPYSGPGTIQQNVELLFRLYDHLLYQHVRFALLIHAQGVGPSYPKRNCNEHNDGGVVDSKAIWNKHGMSSLSSYFFELVFSLPP
jgi:hypothetical protein